jgi:hypothetical protein
MIGRSGCSLFRISATASPIHSGHTIIEHNSIDLVFACERDAIRDVLGGHCLVAFTFKLSFANGETHWLIVNTEDGGHKGYP